MTLRTLNYGNYSIFRFVGNAGLISLNPKSPKNPIDLFKEPLKATLIDPFKGIPGFISSAVLLMDKILHYPL